MQLPIYFDYSSTTPLDKEVFEEMIPYFFEKFGNASSIHSFGQNAKFGLEESRNKIAKFINTKPQEIVFLSSGTEANNFALRGIASVMKRKNKNHIITTKIEHSSILETCNYLSQLGFEISYCDVDEFGIIKIDSLKNLIREKTFLISIMHVNNEIGTINPVLEIGKIAKENEIIFHCDAVQSFGKISIDVENLNCDLMSFSSHKIYGPKGIAALFVKRGLEIEPLIFGGQQERGKRSGTEAIPLIVGFAKATEKIFSLQKQELQKMLELKNLFIASINEKFSYFKNNPIIINGSNSSLANILNISIDSSKMKIDGETLLLNLDLEGIATTSGSACSSGSMKPSHVLLALGKDEKTALATIRFSFGRNTTQEEILYASNKLFEIVKKIGTEII